MCTRERGQGRERDCGETHGQVGERHVADEQVGPVPQFRLPKRSFIHTPFHSQLMNHFAGQIVCIQNYFDM